MGLIENVYWSSGGIVRQIKMKYTETNNIRFLKPSKNSYLGIDGVAIHMSANPTSLLDAKQRRQSVRDPIRASRLG